VLSLHLPLLTLTTSHKDRIEVANVHVLNETVRRSTT
jgi:hypothetical protein